MKRNGFVQFKSPMCLFVILSLGGCCVPMPASVPPDAPLHVGDVAKLNADLVLYKACGSLFVEEARVNPAYRRPAVGALSAGSEIEVLRYVTRMDSNGVQCYHYVCRSSQIQQEFEIWTLYLTQEHVATVVRRKTTAK
ncbi:MAG: hypothetical protein JWN24_732 [Phycisphaerales bacterium]|nr:hypothetical protein [Phycisphaerales bacterium]